MTLKNPLIVSHLYVPELGETFEYLGEAHRIATSLLGAHPDRSRHPVFDLGLDHLASDGATHQGIMRLLPFDLETRWRLIERILNAVGSYSWEELIGKEVYALRRKSDWEKIEGLANIDDPASAFVLFDYLEAGSLPGSAKSARVLPRVFSGDRVVVKPMPEAMFEDGYPRELVGKEAVVTQVNVFPVVAANGVPGNYAVPPQYLEVIGRVLPKLFSTGFDPELTAISMQYAEEAAVNQDFQSQADSGRPRAVFRNPDKPAQSARGGPDSMTLEELLSDCSCHGYECVVTSLPSSTQYHGKPTVYDVTVEASRAAELVYEDEEKKISRSTGGFVTAVREQQVTAEDYGRCLYRLWNELCHLVGI